MTPQTQPTARPESPAPPCPPRLSLPGWEQLPAERQRDLVLTLAAILLKRLPRPFLTPTEVRHE